jgi:hypothetical protein
LDTVDEVFLLAVAFAGFTGLEAAFFSFCVMSFNLAVKMKKGLRQDTPRRKPRCWHRHHCCCDGIHYLMKRHGKN